MVKSGECSGCSGNGGEGEAQVCQCASVYAAYVLLSLVSLGYVGWEMWWPGQRGDWEGSLLWLSFVAAEGWLWGLGLVLGLLTSCTDPGFHLPLPKDDPESLAVYPTYPASPGPSPGPSSPAASLYGDRTDDWAGQPPSPAFPFSPRPQRMAAGKDFWRQHWYGPDRRNKVVFVGSLETELKFCRSCNFVRPPRASHCSACDHCVETKDHHCPWMRNCIARRNYRYFLAFLMVCVAHLCLTVVFLTTVMVLRSDRIVSVLWFTSAGLSLLCLGCLWMVGQLLSFHFSYVLRSITTKEDLELPRGHSVRFQETNPFSYGSRSANLRAIFCGPHFPSFRRYKGTQNLPDIVPNPHLPKSTDSPTITHTTTFHEISDDSTDPTSPTSSTTTTVSHITRL